MDSGEQEALVRRMQAGDAEAFSRIFDEYGTRLLRMAYLITGNYADSEDIVQETFVSCFYKCRDLKDCSRFTTWLYRILTRNAYRIGKRSRREEPMEELFGWYAAGQYVGWAVGQNSGQSCVPYLSLGYGQSGEPYESSNGGQITGPEPACGDQPLDIIIADETRAELWEAVQQLNLKLRTVVVLYYYNDLSTKEIARITQTFEGTVKSRLYTARKILEQKLSKS